MQIPSTPTGLHRGNSATADSTGRAQWTGPDLTPMQPSLGLGFFGSLFPGHLRPVGVATLWQSGRKRLLALRRTGHPPCWLVDGTLARTGQISNAPPLPFSGMKMPGNGLKRAEGPSTSQLRAKQGTSVAGNSEPTQQFKICQTRHKMYQVIHFMSRLQPELVWKETVWRYGIAGIESQRGGRLRGDGSPRRRRLHVPGRGAGPRGIGGSFHLRLLWAGVLQALGLKDAKQIWRDRRSRAVFSPLASSGWDSITPRRATAGYERRRRTNSLKTTPKTLLNLSLGVRDPR